MQRIHSFSADFRRNATALDAASLVSRDVGTGWTLLAGMSAAAAVTTSPNALYPAPFLGLDDNRYATSYQLTTAVIGSTNQTNAAVRLTSPLTPVTPGEYIYSCFVKRAASIQATAFQLEVRGGGGTRYVCGTFDIASSGVVTPRSSVIPGDATAIVSNLRMGVQAYGNGWYRCWIVFNTMEMGGTISTLTPYLRVWDTVAAGQYRMFMAEPLLELTSQENTPRRSPAHPIVVENGKDPEGLPIPINYMVGCGGTNPFFALGQIINMEVPGQVGSAWQVTYDFGGAAAAGATALIQGSADGTTWTTVVTLDINATPVGQTAIQTTFYKYIRVTYGANDGSSAAWGINAIDASGGNVQQRFKMEVFA